MRCEPELEEYGRRAAKEAAMDVDDEGWKGDGERDMAC